MLVNRKIISLSLSLSCVYGLFAPLGTSFAEDPVESIKAFNRLAVQRAELLVTVRGYDKKLATVWHDPAMTSEEIEKIRTELRRMESEIVAKRFELKTAVNALPEVQAVVKERDSVLKEAERLKLQMNDARGDVPVAKPVKVQP